MSLIFTPSTQEIRHALGLADSWPECTIVDAPVKRPDSPRLLVKRNVPDVNGPNGEQLLYLPGNPAISLFTGAGGMDLGIEKAGFCTLVQVEWDQAACQTLLVNRPRAFRYSALIQGDIRQIPTGMILEAGGLEVGEAHLLCGGPPCQGFSTSNSHSASGKYDERNDLVFEYLRVIDQAKPKFFMMENVPGFLSFKGKVDGMEYAERFCHAAYKAYYDLVYGLIDACDYGVPQRRTRFICMGTRRDLSAKGAIASLPKPTHFAERDLVSLEQTLFPESDLITHPPGVRFFPDRPFLKPPHPNHGNEGRSEAFLRFYGDLLNKEPDRIVSAPRPAA